MNETPGLPPYLSTLNPEQRAAVLHEGAPLLILAGAGSGKTRVITTKIAYLVERRGVDPRSILAVTFTNKAAAEMQKRAAELCPAAEGALIRTFHSFCAWFLRRNAAVLGMKSRFVIYDDDDAVTLLRGLYPDLSRGQLSRYAHWISRAKDYALSPGDNLWKITEDSQFPDIYAAYEARLREIGNVDFGDLILRSLELLRDHPEVRERIRQRFSVILVDEYQDSNIAQFGLLRQLAGPETYLCVVGDDDQSIYRFRGAEVRNILTFAEHFPGTQVIKLERNYRSSQEILDVASSVVERNRGRLGKKLWTDRAGGTRAVLAYLPDQDAEVSFVAGLLRDGSYGGTAILYRTNAQSRLFESYFVSAGIPYRVVGTLRFYEREEVKDTLAFLAFLANPKDEVAFRRIVNKPARGIGEVTLEKLLAQAAHTEGDLVRACELTGSSLSKKAAEGVREFLRIILSLTESLATERLPKFIERVIVGSGLLEYYRNQDEIQHTQKVDNLEELINAASQYGNGYEGLAEFLEDIELDRTQESAQAAESDDAVTLITMHNTKGLEFDRVIITGMEDGLFPREEDAENEDELEEERRLFYVAITRARHELYMTSCAMRRIRGKVMALSPSCFLKEIPEDLLETKGTVPGPGGGLEPGDYVYHDEYGTGVVCRKWHHGSELAVMVQFESGRVATFIPRFTPLEKVHVDE